MASALVDEKAWARAGAGAFLPASSPRESEGCAPTRVGKLLQKLVEEYREEQQQAAQFHIDWAKLDAENRLLRSSLGSTWLPPTEHQPGEDLDLAADSALARALSRDLDSSAAGLRDSPSSARCAGVLRDAAAPCLRDPPSNARCAGVLRDAAAPGDDADSVGTLQRTLSPLSLPGELPHEEGSQESIELLPYYRTMFSMNNVRFELRDDWRHDDERAPVEFAGRYLSTSTMLVESLPLQRNSYQVSCDSFCHGIISHPNSPSRLAWGVMGAALVMYDMVVVPLQVFEPGEHLLFSAMDWITLLFWTIDMLISPFVGFVSKGAIEVRPNKVLAHYLRSGRWFLDIVVVAPDWTFTLMALGQNNDAANSVKLLKMLRITRTMRLVRLHKLKWILAHVNDMIDSEYVSILVGIGKMLLFLLLINHFLACGWYATSLLAPNESLTWVEAHQFRDRAWPYKYATSLHWAITQFTPASMHVQPQNLLERWYAIAVVLFALVGFSYIVGSISASLSKIRGMKEEQAHQFWRLKRYLKQNEVPQQLRVRIIRYGEHAAQLQRERVTLEGNRVYQLISEQLRNELACAVAAPHLCVHPLFARLRVLAGVTLRRIANSAISYKQVGCAETVFHPGEKATHMYFVIEGQLRYKSKLQANSMERVDCKEDWISEPALWTAMWKHLGALVAMKESSLLRVEAATFGKIVRLTPQAFNHVKAYAAKFIEWLNEKDMHTLSDIGQGELISEELRAFVSVDDDGAPAR